MRHQTDLPTPVGRGSPSCAERLDEVQPASRHGGRVGVTHLRHRVLGVGNLDDNLAVRDAHRDLHRCAPVADRVRHQLTDDEQHVIGEIAAQVQVGKRRLDLLPDFGDGDRQYRHGHGDTDRIGPPRLGDQDRDVVVRRGQSTTRFCSADCLRLRRTNGAWHGQLSSAGHPLPFIRPRTGPPRRIGRRGTLLNVLPDPPLFDAEVALAPGEALLLSTDGLAEGRRASDFYGDARIATVFGAATGSAQDIAEALLADSIEFQNGRVRDDVAIVVLQVPAG